MLHARLLRYLDEVDRCGSIRKAAARLNVASSAVNRQILALEEELGEPIFERMPRRLRLTITGEVLIAHVRKTLADYAAMREQLDQLRGLQQGRVTLSTTLGLAGGAVAEVAADFARSHPRASIAVRALFADAIPNAVLSGEADLGLAFNQTLPRSLRTLASFELPVGAVMAPDHPLAGRDSLRFAEAAEHPLVVAEPGMNLRATVDTAAARLMIAPRIVAETNSVEMMKTYVRRRAGCVTFLNPLDVAEEAGRGALAFRPLADPWLRPQQLRLFARADGVDPLASRFTEALRAALEVRIAAVRQGAPGAPALP